MTLNPIPGKRVAEGRDFNSEGALQSNAAGQAPIRLDAADAGVVTAALEHSTTNWLVSSVESRQQRRKPPKPFTTSTLQQEARTFKLATCTYCLY